MQKKDYEQAERALLTALKLRPHYGKAYFNLGRMHLDKGDTEKAWECFKNACTKADLDTDIGFGIYAKVSMALNKYEDAIFGYTKTLELNPNQSEAVFNLGNAYFLTKRYQEAAQAFDRTIRVNPAELRAYNNLGESYIYLEQYDKALVAFDRLGDNKKQFPNIYLRAALCHSKLGDQNKAKGSLQELLSNPAVLAATPEQIKQTARAMFAQLGAGNRIVA